MTSEEIIEGLKLLEDNMVYFDELQNDKGKWIDVHELLFETIEVLEQEPCEDCISRQEVIKITDGVNDLPSQKLDKILSLPSVQPKPKPKTDTWSIKEVADALEKHGLMMSEISETEIKAMTKEQNYFRGYKDGKSDVLDKIRAEIEHLTITEGGEDYVRTMAELYSLKIKVLQIIDKYRTEREDKK